MSVIIESLAACLAATVNILRSQQTTPAIPSIRRHVMSSGCRMKAHDQAGPPEAFGWTYGAGQTPSGYGRGLQTNPVNNLCVSELVRRAQTFGTAVGRAQWTQRAPEQSAHSATCAECADLSAGLLRQGAQPWRGPKNSGIQPRSEPFVTRLSELGIRSTTCVAIPL